MGGFQIKEANMESICGSVWIAAETHLQGDKLHKELVHAKAVTKRELYTAEAAASGNSVSGSVGGLILGSKQGLRGGPTPPTHQAERVLEIVLFQRSGPQLAAWRR